MSVSLRASSLTSGAGVTSITRAAAIQGQDWVVLVQIVYDDATATGSPPANYNQITTDVVTDTAGKITRLYAYGHRAGGSAGSETTDAATIACTNSTSQYQELIAFSTSGDDQTTPVDTSSVNHGAGTAITATGVNVARDGSLGIWVKAGYSYPTSVDPVGWASLISDQDGVNDVFTKALNAGATGNVTATQAPGTGVQDGWIASLIIIQPPGAAQAASQNLFFGSL